MKIHTIQMCLVAAIFAIHATLSLSIEITNNVSLVL